MKLLYQVVVIMSLTFEYFASDMNKQYTYKQKYTQKKQQTTWMQQKCEGRFKYENVNTEIDMCSLS